VRNLYERYIPVMKAREEKYGLSQEDERERMMNKKEETSRKDQRSSHPKTSDERSGLTTVYHFDIRKEKERDTLKSLMTLTSSSVSSHVD
jgi:hypothetical protein